MSATKEISHLTTLLKSPSTTPPLARDALIEFILARRGKGWSLYGITLCLIEVMQEVPHHLDSSFDAARHSTHLPHHTDLTPSLSFFGSGNPQFSSTHASRASTSKQIKELAGTLSRCPEGGVSIESGREVLLEWSLGWEGKWVDGSVGGGGKGGGGSGSGGMSTLDERAGKGSLGSIGFNDISSKYQEIIKTMPFPSPEVLALMLSLRMSLGYLTEKELGEQLVGGLLGLREGEECLRIWVGRRLGGDGRWGVGKVLEGLERQCEQSRPALSTVFKLVKSKYLLPTLPVHRIPLPAPSKSKLLPLLQNYITSCSFSNTNTPILPSSPTTPSGLRTPTQQIFQQQNGNANEGGAPSLDDLPAYAFELLSEWLTREKRELMKAEKWAKSGRKQISRDLNDLEEKICFSQSGGRAKFVKNGGARDGVNNGVLVPVFEVLRRLYSLELPVGSAGKDPEGELEEMGFEPIRLTEMDEVWFPPTAQTVTSALYVNPRLETIDAVEVIMELVEYEKDLRTFAVKGAIHVEGGLGSEVGHHGRRSSEGTIMRRDGRGRGMGADDGDTVIGQLAWGPLEKGKMAKVLESIERRFPDGEYAQAFDMVRARATTGIDLQRAPSYTTVASMSTAQRTESYIRDNNRHSRSFSMGAPGLLNNLQPLPPINLDAAFASGSSSSSGSSSRRPSETASAVPAFVPARKQSLAVDTTAPPESSTGGRLRRMSFGRTNSTPGSEPSPGRLTQAIRKMSMSNRELSSQIGYGSSSRTPPMGTEVDDPTESLNSRLPKSDSQSSVQTDGTLEGIYAGYGDLISPISPIDPQQQEIMGERFPAGSVEQLSPAQPIEDKATNSPVREKRRTSILRRPGFLGGSKSSESSPASSPRRHQHTSSTSSAAGRSMSAALTSPAPATPINRLNDATRVEPPPDRAVTLATPTSSSPTNWRNEFQNMNNGMGMLRPSPRHTSSSSLSGLTGQSSSRTTPR